MVFLLYLYTSEHVADDHVWIAMPVKVLGIALGKQASKDLQTDLFSNASVCVYSATEEYLLYSRGLSLQRPPIHQSPSLEKLTASAFLLLNVSIKTWYCYSILCGFSSVIIHCHWETKHRRAVIWSHCYIKLHKLQLSKNWSVLFWVKDVLSIFDFFFSTKNLFQRCL